MEKRRHDLSWVQYLGRFQGLELNHIISDMNGESITKLLNSLHALLSGVEVVSYDQTLTKVSPLSSTVAIKRINHLHQVFRVPKGFKVLSD